MKKTDLQCLIVGKTFKDYPSLAHMLRQLDVGHISFKEINTNQASIKHGLKQLSGASLVFVPNTLFNKTLKNNSVSTLSLQHITDLIWQYASDAIVIVLEDQENLALYRQLSEINHLSNIHISHLKPVNQTSLDQSNSFEYKEFQLRLQFLSQMALQKNDFRQCKHLLGIAEKRCQWLVDSSVVPIAFISRDLHLYANTAYLDLLGLESLQGLRSIAVKDVIVADEHDVFDSFVRSFTRRQKTQSKETQSLFLRMKSKQGGVIKTNIRLTPSVFQGKRCIQLWVHALDSSSKEQSEISKIWDVKSNTEQVAESLVRSSQSSDQSMLYARENSDSNQSHINSSKSNDTNKNIEPALILKEIIRRKEAQIFTQRLLNLNQFGSKSSDLNRNNADSNYYLIALHVPFVQRKAVDELLTKVAYEEIDTLRSLFWDKVKITRLLEILSKKKEQNLKLLVRLSDATLRDDKQISWLQAELIKTGNKASMVVFMLPSRLDDSGQRACVRFINRIKPYGSQFALDDFFINPESLDLLKHAKPDVLRFSLPWVQQIEGDEKREIALSRLIRQLEARKIKTIMPCGFSVAMKRLFLLSGASFCQEKTSKSV